MRKIYNSISAKLLAKKHKLRLKNIHSKTNKVTIKDVKLTLKKLKKLKKSKKLKKNKFGNKKWRKALISAAKQQTKQNNISDMFSKVMINNIYNEVDLDDYLSHKSINKSTIQYYNPEIINKGCTERKNFPLKKLNKNIKSLNLSNCNNNIEELSNFINLNKLNLHNNNIKDLNPLTTLINLTE